MSGIQIVRIRIEQQNTDISLSDTTEYYTPCKQLRDAKNFRNPKSQLCKVCNFCCMLQYMHGEA